MRHTLGAVAGFVTIVAAVVDNSTNIAILNLTPYTWSQSVAPHGYQLENWNTQWPNTFPPGSYAAAATVETGILGDPADSAGEVSYQVTSASGSNVQIQVRGGGSFPDYTFAVNSLFQGVSTENNGQGSTLPLGWESGSWTPFILGGKTGSLVGNNPPVDWMFQNLEYLGCLNLQSLVLPGSHDAGMSQIQDKSEFATVQNTQTQTLNIEGQLINGMRYFDIRPSLTNGVYKTSHWSDIEALGWQGANGQSIADIIANVNAFTATNKELIVLELSHSLNIDENYTSFDDDAWDGVLHQLQGLQNLYMTTQIDNLLDAPLSDFISNTAAVVVICDERDQAWLQSKGYYTKGFWPSSAFRNFNSYADSDDLNTVRADQYAKFTNPANHADQLFLLSWTMTLGISSANPLDSIRSHATYANTRLFEVGTVPQCGPSQWVDWATGLVPNIVLIDDVLDTRLAALALALSRQGHDCSS